MMNSQPETEMPTMPSFTTVSSHIRRACGLCVLVCCTAPLDAAWAQEQAARPNILWLTCEDISPNLGCYGDAYAVTPHIDKLATQGVRYTHAFAPIGVCAPSRSTLITGMYACSLGSQHMRCDATLPGQVTCFPEYFRMAGYYCTNNTKTDYNFKMPKGAWDESSGKAHWKNRPAGKPFFAVFNFTTSHESQIRLPEKQYQERTKDFTEQQRHDPAKVSVPPYHPDTPEVRRDWARYADMITYMDGQVGEALQELQAAGLADDTIVCYFSDHGAGMPRSKRWLYDSSLRVPLVVRFPAKFAKHAPAAAGQTTDRLVSFVDFAPTMLSLASVDAPKHLQGQAFLGDKTQRERDYIFGFRDRMDERYDLLRAVRDKRYKYIRNYMPHLPWFHHQHIDYMFAMPTMQSWQRLADAGKLTGAPAVFMAATKPMEELYDTQSDPHEVQNLAASAAHREVLEHMRQAHRKWQAEIVDLGLMPEGDLRTRFGGQPEYDAVRSNPSAYPLNRIAAAADLANAMNAEGLPNLIALLKDTDPAVRYWGATGIGALGESGRSANDLLRPLLTDRAATVRVAAADALCRLGDYKQALPALTAALADDNPAVRLQAINVLDRLDERARPALEAIKNAKTDGNPYVVRVAEHALRAFP